MTVTIRCPNPACGKSAGVSAAVLGRDVRCKHCGTRFTAAPAADARPGRR